MQDRATKSMPYWLYLNVARSLQQHSLGCGEDCGVLVAQLGVLLDVLDEVDERVLVELPVAEVRLALQHPLGCKAR